MKTDLFEAEPASPVLALVDVLLAALDPHLDDEHPGDAVAALLTTAGMVMMAGRNPAVSLLRLEDEACGRLRLVLREIHANQEKRRPNG